MNRPGSLFTKGADTRAALRRAGILTGAGAVGLIPALILVAAGFAGLQRPDVLVHPALVFGGLAAAFAASFVAVTHWELSDEPGGFRIICTIRKRAADLVVLVVSLILLGIIIGYLFVENFVPR